MSLDFFCRDFQVSGILVIFTYKSIKTKAMTGEKEKVFRYYTLDTHTEVIPEDLTSEEKRELGIDENLFAHFNEIGFSTPVNSNAWEEDCFNVLIGDTPDTEEVDVLLLPISRLPKRFEATYRDIVKEREKYSS